MIGIKYILETDEILWQYDAGRRLIVPQLVQGQIPTYSTQFYSKNYEHNVSSDKYDYDSTKDEYYVTIPQALLYDSGILEVYAFNISNGKEHTETLTKFEVTERPAPTNVIYTPEELAIWDTKQDKLVSGVNIKTINTVSILGSGNIEIGQGGTVVKDHSQLEHLDYDNCGHTGFARLIHTHNVEDITDFPSLSTVATTGNYNDLINKPDLSRIPTQTQINYWNNKADKSDIPIKTSQLINDSEFITKTSLSEEYATKEYVTNSVAIKQDKITETNKLSYNLISGAPTDLSQFTNNGATSDKKYVTELKLTDYRTAANQDIIDTGIKNSVSSNTSAISAINLKIPNEASSTNKLVDKLYVENNRGKFIPKNDSSYFFDSYQDLVSYTGAVNNNDYAIVEGIENDVSFYDYYKVTVTSESVRIWSRLYRLNKAAAFSQSQWSAINSGITNNLVNTFSSHLDNYQKHIPTGSEAGEGLVYDGSSWRIQKGYGYSSSYSDEIYWDGDTTGKESLEGEFFKVSDISFPTGFDISKATVNVTLTTVTTETTTSETFEGIVFNPIPNLYVIINSSEDPFIYIFTEDMYNYSKGIYLLCVEVENTKYYVSAFNYSNSIYHKFDKNLVLPEASIASSGLVYDGKDWVLQEGQAYWEDLTTITWDGVVTEGMKSFSYGGGIFYKVSEYRFLHDLEDLDFNITYSGLGATYSDKGVLTGSEYGFYWIRFKNESGTAWITLIPTEITIAEITYESGIYFRKIVDQSAYASEFKYGLFNPVSADILPITTTVDNLSKNSQIPTALATYNAIRNLLPTKIKGKYLHVNETTESLEWADVNGGTYIAIYNETLYAPILEAYNSGKRIICQDKIEGTTTLVPIYYELSEFNNSLTPNYFDFHRIELYRDSSSGNSKTILSNRRIYSDNVWDRITFTKNWDKIEFISNKVREIWPSSTNDQYPSAKCVYDNLQNKQNTLVSGTNIKTINNQSILGSGNIEISGGGTPLPTPTTAGSGLVWNGTSWIAQDGYGYKSGSQTVINWNGDITGKESIQNAFYKMSSTTPTDTEMATIQFIFSLYVEGSTTTDTTTATQLDEHLYGIGNQNYIWIATQDTTFMETPITKGIWFIKFSEGSYTSNLTYGSQTVTQFDSSLIPHDNTKADISHTHTLSQITDFSEMTETEVDIIWGL